MVRSQLPPAPPAFVRDAGAGFHSQERDRASAFERYLKSGSGRAFTKTFLIPSFGSACHSLPGRLIVGQRALNARMLVRFQPRQPVLESRASTRPVVK